MWINFAKAWVARLQQIVITALRTWTRPGSHGILAGAITDFTCGKRTLILENLLLRQQVIALKRQIKRPRLTWRDRALVVFLSSRISTWKQTLLIVQPETVLHWHRELFRLVWQRKSRHKTRRGRPRLDREQVSLIRRMARENMTWGAEQFVVNF